MNTKTALRFASRCSTLIPVFFLLLLAVVPLALAQEEPALQLSLRRDFGTAVGDNIQGTFTLRAAGPDNLERVEFLLDGEVIGQAAAAPFQIKFQTDAYPPGTHVFSATGYTAVGQTLSSNTLTRNFLTGSQTMRTILWVVIPLILIAVGGRWLTSKIAGRGQAQSKEMTAIDGPFGGTICPKCKRPFARHWWGFNVGVGKYDRCPHCGKWSVVHRVHPDVLAASLEAMKQADAQAASPSPDSDEEARRRLDDSRFDS
ncbi:MAG: hypothetical protein KC441_06505 [Anaerolineales bacterium]|nr:hypothetical protein [Anaerolineales bacterium]MCB8988222.1 Ig-like domain-containing protein [Ardenticatenaceae bacterium]